MVGEHTGALLKKGSLSYFYERNLVSENKAAGPPKFNTDASRLKKNAQYFMGKSRIEI
jgi:hypothetical protein